ncbi:MAG TPA: GDP-mannose 4,6-dehydratase [Candidatus Omnitrophota bacterium]|nr:GDP-mannose 4,6-dehydratase [Candidatus Omnitrophota bacterium]HQL41902.1 GDP-mannose 4,6-dehydratase [Candidatus Omnitrophota bacterium]
MAEKIVILGSNSFSGASFAAQCLDEGLDVLGISRSDEPADVFLPYKWNMRKSSTFRFDRGDINHDLDRMADTIEKFQPDYLVNFASQSMVAQSWEHPEHWYRTNILGIAMFCERIRHFRFLKRYVHVSTPEVYGSCAGDVTEDHFFNPSTPYAVSRAAGDFHLRVLFRQYQFPVVFTRAANVYGPGQQLYRIIPRTILFLMLGRKLQLHGGGHSVRSFIHIRDVSEATLKIMRQGQNGQTYHIATDRHIAIKDAVRLICDMMNKDLSEAVEVVDDRPGKDAAYLLDSSKLRGELGWKDHIKLEEGIRETVQWAQDNIDELKKQPMDYIHKP